MKSIKVSLPFCSSTAQVCLNIPSHDGAICEVPLMLEMAWICEKKAELCLYFSEMNREVTINASNYSLKRQQCGKISRAPSVKSTVLSKIA